jgi:two-component system response regulator NreC
LLSCPSRSPTMQTPESPAKTGVTILVVDDHHVVRRGLRTVLETEPGFSVVGEAADGLEALEMVERLQPDVVIVDIMLPSLNGLELIRRVRQGTSHTRMVVLSMHANEAYVLEALRNGASGYVLKDASGADVVHAVRTALAGGRYLSPPLSERAIEAYGERRRPTVLDRYETLTAREREVLQLAAEGFSSVDIAVRLSISARTVEAHRAHFMQKLGLRGQTELVRYAIRRGLLPSELGPHTAELGPIP